MRLLISAERKGWIMGKQRHGYYQWKTEDRNEIINLEHGRSNITKKLFHQLNLEEHFHYEPASKKRYIIISKKGHSAFFKAQYLLSRSSVLRFADVRTLPDGDNGIIIYLSKADFYRFSHHSYAKYFSDIIKRNLDSEFKLTFRTMRNYNIDKDRRLKLTGDKDE